MESSTILNRMASYDFKAPIDIVCFEEENSNDTIDLTSSQDLNEEETILNKKARNNNTDLETQISQKSPEIQANVSTKNTKRKQTSGKGKSAESKKQKKVSKKDSTAKANPNLYENSHEYINDEMKTVSKYLTLIMESYNHYLSILNNKKSSYHDVSLTKRSFMTTKYHFFNAAYNYVISFIMPNETNQAFNQILLNYISNMASERIKTDCHLGIRELYFEMIQWVKLKQYKMLTDSRNSSILRRHLNDPPLISTVQQPYSTSADQNKLCIFSSGPIGSQISINVDKSIISNNNQLLNQINRPSENSIALQQNQVIQQHSQLPVNGNFSFNNINLPENRLPQYQLPHNPSGNITSMNENNRVSQNSLINYYHTTNNYQSNNYVVNNANNVMNRTVQMHPNNVINQNGNLRTYRRDHQTPTTPVQDPRGPPPMYHSPIAEHPNQHMTQVPAIQSNISSGPDLTRSSVSTDSGFISPVGSKSANIAIEEIMNQLIELENTVQPTKSTAAPTTCHVCHTKSALMCSACFKRNYCSTKCQSEDWEVHRLICQR